MKTFATDLLEATLVDKFDAALRSVELENGTLLATVLVSAIMVDLRCSGSEDGVDTIDTLDEDAIRELGAFCYSPFTETAGHSAFLSAPSSGRTNRVRSRSERKSG